MGRRQPMTVYVDDMYLHAMGKFGRMKMSHMIADTEDELHAMARRIGIARKWYQGDHYDVAMNKRELAISFGAKAITLRECGVMAVHRRRTRGELPKPEDVPGLLREFGEQLAAATEGPQR